MRKSGGADHSCTIVCADRRRYVTKSSVEESKRRRHIAAPKAFVRGVSGFTVLGRRSRLFQLKQGDITLFVAFNCPVDTTV
jgi:hypothetical protein